MDPEGEMAALNVKLAEEEEAIQHGVPSIVIHNEHQVAKEGESAVKNADTNDAQTKETKKTKINEDLLTIIMILILYILQGIPFGLTFSVPLILSSRKVSYSDQGTFSFALWPFSVRLLWAPIVDSVFIRRIGRRKTWVCSCFFLVGIIMVSMAEYVHNILQIDRVKENKDIYILTLIFGILVFLIATEDIALDAWSLDLLLEKNVGWQSICNSVGMGAGGFLGGALFLTLESEKFANQIRPLFNLEPKNQGIVTIKQFCYVFGVTSLVTSISILIFKSEHSKRKRKQIESAAVVVAAETQQLNDTDDKNTPTPTPTTESPPPSAHPVERTAEHRSILEVYKLIWSLLKLPAIRKLIFIFLTVRIGFSTENVVRLKLVEMGVEREKISMLAVLVSPIIMFLPFMLKNYINGPKPLDLFRVAYIFKMLILIIIILFVYYVPYFKDDATNTFTYLFYLIFFLISLVSSMISFASWVSLGGFCAKISDKSIGGTYLTFIGFWLSIGANWSKTATLYLISWLTFKKCIHPTSWNTDSPMTTPSNLTDILNSISTNTCSSASDEKSCAAAGAQCVTTFDGFYVISYVLILVALLWLILTRRLIDYLQTLPKSAWCVVTTTTQQTPQKTDVSIVS